MRVSLETSLGDSFTSQHLRLLHCLYQSPTSFVSFQPTCRPSQTCPPHQSSSGPGLNTELTQSFGCHSSANTHHHQPPLEANGGIRTVRQRDCLLNIHANPTSVLASPSPSPQRQPAPLLHCFNAPLLSESQLPVEFPFPAVPQLYSLILNHM